MIKGRTYIERIIINLKVYEVYFCKSTGNNIKIYYFQIRMEEARGTDDEGDFVSAFLGISERNSKTGADLIKGTTEEILKQERV